MINEKGEIMKKYIDSEALKQKFAAETAEAFFVANREKDFQ